MTQIKIFDNFLSEKMFQKISNEINSDKISFILKKGTTFNDGLDIYWLKHSIYNNFKPESNLFFLMDEFIQKLNITSIIQIRLNLVLKQPYKNFKTNFHTDYDNYKNLKTGLFYFSVDGTGTIFKIGEEEKLVKCKPNRMVVFDSEINHCGYLNNNFNTRFAINFNYYEK